MSNMSYCRFQNTLGDLLDCEEALHDTDWDNISDSERKAALEMFECIERIVGDFNFDEMVR